MDMEYILDNSSLILLAGVGLTFIVCIIVLILLARNSSNKYRQLLEEELQKQLADAQQTLTTAINGVIAGSGSQIQQLQVSLSESQRYSAATQSSRIEQLQTSLNNQVEGLRNAVSDNLSDMGERIRALEKNNKDDSESIKYALVTSYKTIKDENSRQLNDIKGSVENRLNESVKSQAQGMVQLQSSINSQLEQSRSSSTDQLGSMLESISRLQETNAEKLESIRNTIAGSMKDIRDENSRKLDEIKGTVDEKLQTTLEKRISESFKTVSDQLEQVYKGIGEMQTLASDVGGLKKVLSGVKTRGILGEVQLGAILQEILAPDQYVTNAITRPGGSERVEFAVKMPGSDGFPVLLPIDSKFPGDKYAQLVAAQESGDRNAADAAYKALETVIKQEARDICDKYICVPYTTEFGIMFLPFEGLYAEVVNRGLMGVLQRDYHVNVTGPSTMAAFLNSLQMGFKTLAIQKRSSEVWHVLGAVKTEFETFGEVLDKMEKHLKQTNEDLERLSGTRTRAIMRKLKDIETLDMSEASKLLDLPADMSDDDLW